MVTPTSDHLADLSEEEHQEIRTLGWAVYPPGTFDDWPGRHVEWDMPEWCVRVRDGDALVSYVGLYVRDALLDGRPVRVGGVGNVKTHPEARGRGHASAALRHAAKFFRARADIAFALLVCEPTLLAYYARLGWREFAGRLLIRQRGGPCAFTLCRVMTLGVGADGPRDGTLDLCGPPW